MDPREAARRCIQVILKDNHTLKALILDHETARILGLLINHTQLLQHDVILVEKLSAKRTTPVPHITAVVFIRPTAENVDALCLELRNPHYDSYKLYFSNIARRAFIEQIADADQQSLITDVREVYADFYAFDSLLLSFEVCPCLTNMQLRTGSLRNIHLERTIDGIAATLLALKRKPLIRFDTTSPLCQNIAERLCVKIDQESGLFEFQVPQNPPLLLILDRREDPVTPLLNQWTYEAMIHELIGIQCNRVSLLDAPNVPDEFREIVLDESDDEFFRHNRYCNFGDLGLNLKALVDTFQNQIKSRNKLDTIESMMKFVDNYPEFRKSASKVSKHVVLTAELSRLVGKLKLLEVSELEQDIACREAEVEHREQIMTLLKNSNVSTSDKLRLVMLYSLRYEETGDKGLILMKNALLKCDVGPAGTHLITAIREYAGASKRSADVFSNRSFFAVASNKVRRGIGGVDNVYTQHEPLLIYTLDDLFRNKMKQTDFPLARTEHLLAEGVKGSSTAGPTVPPPQEVFVLVAGGVTYEEAKCVSSLNGTPNSFVPSEGSNTASATAAARQAGANVVLMGTCVHNSTSFAKEIAKNASV